MARSPWRAHHRDRPLRELRREPVAGEGAQLDGDRAGEVAVGDLAGLADIQDHARLVVELFGLDHRELGLGQVGGAPGGHPAGQLTHQVVIADGAALAGQLPAVLVLVQDEDQRPGVVQQPAQPAGERRAQLDRQRPGDVAGRERGDGAGVDHQPAAGQVLLDLVGREQGQDPPVAAEQLGADPVALPQPQEVRRVAAEAGQQLGHEGVLVGGGQQPVVAAFGANGGRALVTGRGGAERAGAVGRVHRQLVGQRQEPPVQGPVGGPGQRLGQLGAGQVGAGHRADQQGPAAEHGQRPSAVQQQVAGVLGGVPRGGQHPEGEPAQVDLLAVLQAAMGEAEPARARGEDLGAVGGGQLPAAGQEVGMQVGLGGVGDLEPPPAGQLQVRGGIPGRIDDQRPPVAQLDHIGAVAQAFVDDRVNGSHGGLLGWIRGQVPVTARPAACHSGSPSSSRRAAEALLAQQGHGLVGEGAVGAAAVGDDLPVSGQLGQPPPQLADRDGDRPGQVPGGILGGGPHIQHHQVVAVLEPAGQLLAGDWLQLVAAAEVGGGQPLDLGQAAGGQGPQGPPELEHLRGGQPVVDRGALTPAADQPGLAQDLQVLAGVGHRQADLAGQGLHGPLAVGEHVQQLDAPAAGQGLGRPGELVEQGRLGRPVTHVASSHALFK